MKVERLILFILIFIIFGCNGKLNTDYSNIEDDINELVLEVDKRNFLETILKDDQKVRNSEEGNRLMNKYGNNSREYMKYIKAQWRQDEINLKKIDAYFQKFGYPSKKELGREAATAPWLVIHHLTDTGIRDKYFEILYKAYLDEYIDDTAFSLYLGRSYDIIFGERHQMKSPYKSEDQINQLIQELGLEKRRAKIQY